jgi:hypothetical protein
MAQEFMFELYLRNHNDDTTDFDPYETKWGFKSDAEARWGAIGLMDEIAAEGHDTSEMWCSFHKDSNNWTKDSQEFCIYNGMDYSDVDEWIEETRKEQLQQEQEGLANE